MDAVRNADPRVALHLLLPAVTTKDLQIMVVKRFLWMPQPCCFRLLVLKAFRNRAARRCWKWTRQVLLLRPALLV